MGLTDLVQQTLLDLGTGFPCNDGWDNDADGRVDSLDPNCRNGRDTSERK